MRLFARLGWAMSGVWPIEGTERALSAAAEGATDDEVDAILCEAWNGKHSQWMVWSRARLRRMGAGLVPTRQLFWRRADLVEAAIEHHQAGVDEASIPIVLAQIDGLSYDFFGKSFYPMKSGGPAVDDETLAGFEGNLEVARRAFTSNTHETTACGALSRHGIQHGRELAYDTEVNSIKFIALLLSLIEHWKDEGKRIGIEARQAHEEMVAGPLEIDADVRCIDDRELPELREFRSDFGFAYVSRALVGRFERINFDQPFAKELREKNLDSSRAALKSDDTGIWFTYRLPNGREMAWAIALTERQEAPQFDEWWWDASDAPAAAPWDDESGWSSELTIPISWEPELVL